MWCAERLRGRLRRRLGNAGNAAVEFALLVPLLGVLLAGTAEAAMYVRSWYRLERTAAEVANITSQFEVLRSADVATVFDAANAIAAPWRAWSPASTSPRARIVMSVVSGTAGGNSLSWTCSRGAAGLPAEVAGRTALPNGLIVPPNQTVIVVEVISEEKRWRLVTDSILGAAADTPIRTYAILRPRLSSLNVVTGGCPA